MPELVADCPRCRSRRMTFDLMAAKIIGVEHGWQNWYESFGVCRHCGRTTIYVLSESVNADYKRVHQVGLLNLSGSVNNYVNVECYVSLKDEATALPPDHVPKEIADVFREAATCLAVDCYNAAGTMFRLCIDLSTRSLLPTEDVEGLNAKTRRDLGLRLPWLFAQGRLPTELRDLSTCIREDGNDAAHAGALNRFDANDLLDFTTALLERLYTEPARLRLAQQRRDSRRGKSSS